MLAFDVSVYRLPDKSASEGTDMDERLMRGDYHELLVQWTVAASPGCLGWIEDLVGQGKARELNGNGYPMLYVGNREAIISALPVGRGRTADLADKLATSRDDEALVVTAWDLS